jgi:hypothetical protein
VIFTNFHTLNTSDRGSKFSVGLLPHILIQRQGIELDPKEQMLHLCPLTILTSVSLKQIFIL